MTDRFKELREKGYMNLSAAERAEYSALKGNETQKGDTVTLTKKELDDMVNGIVLKAMGDYKEKLDKLNDSEGLSEAIKMGKWMKAREFKKKNPVARLKIYREDGLSEPGILIDWKFKNYGFNEETRKSDVLVYHITALYENGEKKEYDVRWSELIANEEFELVEIIKQDIEEQEMIQGQGEYPRNDKGYTYSNPGFFGVKEQRGDGTFDYVVKRKVVICTVKRPNGKILVLDSSKLNA